MYIRVTATNHEIPIPQAINQTSELSTPIFEFATVNTRCCAAYDSRKRREVFSGDFYRVRSVEKILFVLMRLISPTLDPSLVTLTSVLLGGRLHRMEFVLRNRRSCANSVWLARQRFPITNHDACCCCCCC